MISTDDISNLERQFGRVGIVRFDGHVFVFQQPNAQHARDWRRANANASTSADATDELARQILVAFDDMICPEPASRGPMRLAFNAWLATRPLAIDNAYFGPVLSELLGQTETGTAENAGKGCSVTNPTSAP